MRNLAKNSTYIVVIHKGADAFNTYSKVVNAYKITNGKRSPLEFENERVGQFTGSRQIAKEYLNRIGFNVPRYESEAQNLVVITHDVKYRSLNK